jgi:hypothetical protein
MDLSRTGREGQVPVEALFDAPAATLEDGILTGPLPPLGTAVYRLTP